MNPRLLPPLVFVLLGYAMHRTEGYYRPDYVLGFTLCLLVVGGSLALRRERPAPRRVMDAFLLLALGIFALRLHHDPLVKYGVGSPEPLRWLLTLVLGFSAALWLPFFFPRRLGWLSGPLALALLVIFFLA